MTDKGNDTWTMPREVPQQKRFMIVKPYEGPPFDTPWGKAGEGQGIIETVEEYDDEYTARVRVAILNHGLAKKKYTLEEQVDVGEWETVDT